MADLLVEVCLKRLVRREVVLADLRASVWGVREQ